MKLLIKLNKLLYNQKNNLHKILNLKALKNILLKLILYNYQKIAIKFLIMKLMISYKNTQILFNNKMMFYNKLMCIIKIINYWINN